MSMFGPEGGLVRQYSSAAIAASIKVSPPAAPPAGKVILRRTPLLPMQGLPPQHGCTLALTPQQQALPQNRPLEVTNLLTKRLSVRDAQTDASWVATVVSEQSSPMAMPRLTKEVLSAPVAVLLTPAMVSSSPTSSSSVGAAAVATVTPIHFICRCVSSSLGADNEMGNSVMDSLRRYHVGSSSNAAAAVDADLSESVWEEEDPILFQKQRKELEKLRAKEGEQGAKERPRERPDSEATKIGERVSDSITAQAVLVDKTPKPSSYLKAVPQAGQKREREGDDGGSAGRSPLLTSAEHNAMPPPSPVQKVPLDLEGKTAIIAKQHLAKTMKFDDLWKDVARSLDTFKEIRHLSKDIQTEWARVCKAAVQRFLEQHGCTVADKNVTIPATLSKIH